MLRAAPDFRARELLVRTRARAEKKNKKKERNGGGPVTHTAGLILYRRGSVSVCRVRDTLENSEERRVRRPREVRGKTWFPVRRRPGAAPERLACDRAARAAADIYRSQSDKRAHRRRPPSLRATCRSTSRARRQGGGEKKRSRKQKRGPENTALLRLQVSYPGICAISVDPPVYTVDDFLSAEECDALMDATRDHMTSTPAPLFQGTLFQGNASAREGERSPLPPSLLESCW